MAEALYGTIGGRLKIKAAVDLFYEKVLADPILRPFFESADMNGLRARQSMFVSMLLGGRVVYTGRSVHAAHEQARKMGLSQVHFDKFLKHFQDSLGEVGVPADKVDDIIRLLKASSDAILKQ